MKQSDFDADIYLAANFIILFIFVTLNNCLYLLILRNFVLFSIKIFTILYLYLFVVRGVMVNVTFGQIFSAATEH